MQGVVKPSHPGIVDQDVEPLELALDECRRLSDRVGPLKVNLDKSSIKIFTLQLRRRSLPEIRATFFETLRMSIPPFVGLDEESGRW